MTAARNRARSTPARAIPSARRFMTALLAQESVPGGMVRSVNLRVTVDTAPIEHPAVGEELGAGRRIRVRLRRVTRLVVALLAQTRRLHDLQARVQRPMRIVAGATVLAHRRVLPEHRGPLLGVAAVAVLVDRLLLQERRPDAAVRVVAGGA